MDVREELELYKAHPEPVPASRYHKTAEGDYQHGDLFMGVAAKGVYAVVDHHYETITEAELDALLASPIHEHRAVAVCILAKLALRGPGAVRQEIMEWYLARLERVNSWDFVDASAPAVVGLRVAETKNFGLLHELVANEHLWTKRIGVVATLTLIRKGFLDETLAVLREALSDRRDLIHKAVGWMLREVGKRDRNKLDRFLRENYRDLPRTSLRYAIERHEETERKNILKGIFKEETNHA
jgi:3-methyladenine DNA glycosylase AlkD